MRDQANHRWTLNQSKILQRGWTRADIKERLGEGQVVNWKGTSMRVWPLEEIEAAENADPEFGDRTMGRERNLLENERRKASDELARQAQQREREKAASWSNLARRVDALRAQAEWLASLHTWAEAGFDLSAYTPVNSDLRNLNVSSFEERTRRRDRSILKSSDFTFFIHNVCGLAQRVLLWLPENGEKAVAILKNVGMDPRHLEWSDRFFRDLQDGYFVIKVSLEVASSLTGYGDCYDASEHWD